MNNELEAFIKVASLWFIINAIFELLKLKYTTKGLIIKFLYNLLMGIWGIVVLFCM